MEPWEDQETELSEDAAREKDNVALRLIFVLVILGLAAILYGVFGRRESIIVYEKDQPAIRSASEVLQEHSIPLNTADTYQLQLLPDIGPELAGRIIAYRESHGPFTAVEELLEVEGIGNVTLSRIRDYLTLEGPESTS